jgi:hypothetical protein
MLPSWLALVTPIRAYITLAAMALLVATWVPWAKARTTAAAEARAQALVQLLTVALAEGGTWNEPPDAEVVFARLLRLALRDGVDLGSLQCVVPPADTFLAMADEHYLYHAAASPADARELVADGRAPAREVAAWPRDERSAGHTVFFVPDDGLAAFTRNLNTGYHGTGNHRLRPGRAQRRPGGVLEVTRSYRSYDDERWIVF